MYNKYDIIYSLGSGCGCAMIMDHARLRSFAGPFDWIRSDDGSFDKSFIIAPV